MLSVVGLKSRQTAAKALPFALDIDRVRFEPDRFHYAA